MQKLYYIRSFSFYSNTKCYIFLHIGVRVDAFHGPLKVCPNFDGELYNEVTRF
jgi:hypothetical protein